jgi:oxygen-independent coproporphyrinogen III oxidase
MAGIYIHIPFCRQACHYCDFYFTVSPQRKAEFVTALLHEIALTRDYLSGEPITTIYFGGGTPSQLPASAIARILEQIHRYHDTQLVEVTLEANPDDLSAMSLAELKTLQPLGLNRFSIGVQSFREEDLRYMNRAHSATEAIDAVRRAQDIGFETLSLDLIYGTPTMNDEQWLYNLDTYLSLAVPHLSAYALTVEPRTQLHRDITKGISTGPDQAIGSAQYDILMDVLRTAGYDHYEISNFSLPQRHAIHNTNYWRGVPYLGLGPSAHSYNGASRRWAVRNLKTYIDSLAIQQLPYEQETLTAAQCANEYIMTALRTMWGMELAHPTIESYMTHIQKSLLAIDTSHYTLTDTHLILTQQGKHFADAIAAELFII